MKRSPLYQTLCILSSLLLRLASLNAATTALPDPLSGGEYPLYICISFSMPNSALLFFSKELTLYGGAFVLQGLPNNSFADLFKRVSTLKELGMGAPILIDPERFEKLRIEAVPTIILDSALSTKEIDLLSGNIPLSCALKQFAEKGDNAPLAKALLKKGEL